MLGEALRPAQKARSLSGHPVLLLLLPVALALALPLVVESTYLRHLLITAFIWAVVASSWDLSLGYGGIFNFAHLAFFGLGVYAYAILTKVLGISPWLGLAAGGLTAVLAALIVCLPVLRLKGIYVILVTFAFSQLTLHLILSQADITGGAQGMVLLPALEAFGHKFSRGGKLAYYYAGLMLLIVSTLYLKAIVRSSFGMSIVALRDHEDYAVSRGVSIARQRLLTMGASALFTGVAGAFYAAYLRVASPEVFGFGTLSLVLSMLLVGGTATVTGPVIAAFALTLLAEAIVDLGAWRFLIIATLIVLTMRFYPGGLHTALTGLTGRWRAMVGGS
jgi:branched-chain amino acid transport system permease protein